MKKVHNYINVLAEYLEVQVITYYAQIYLSNKREKYGNTSNSKTIQKIFKLKAVQFIPTSELGTFVIHRGVKEQRRARIVQAQNLVLFEKSKIELDRALIKQIQIFIKSNLSLAHLLP